MRELTVPDVIHRLPPLVEEAGRFLRGCRGTRTPRVRVWRGPRRGFGAVYPGSFDPWTLAHDAILRATLRRVRGAVVVLLDLDTIDKPSHAAPLAERLAILALHLASEKRVAIGISTHGRFLEKARALGKATFVVGEDTHERVLAPRYYEDPERELAELHRRARFLVAPRWAVSGRRARATTTVAPTRGSGTRHGAWRSARLPLSPVDQARSATLARRAFAAGRLPWDQLAPDVLLACWQLGLYGVRRLMPVWVVTAFLESGDRVLLVKRGQRVGTYRGAWSGVSGYLDWPVRCVRTLIECGPGRGALRQVMREIHEETGIGPRSIKLVRTGRELAADDPVHRREWRVRPFLFRAASQVVPRLDWENVESRWCLVRGVHRMPTVPRLTDALGNALGGWDRWFSAQLAKLLSDRRGGAMEIAFRFLLLAREAPQIGLSRFPEVGSRRLAAAHPMAPLIWLRDRLESGRSADALLRALIREGRDLFERAVARLSRASAIATFSYSSSVRTVLSRLGKPVTIRPDPCGHAVRLRNQLASERVTARVTRRPPRGGVMVVGADAVLPDGSIINARGTTKAIREAGLPVVVLAQRCKFIDKAPPLRRGFERVPAEVLRDAEFITG